MSERAELVVKATCSTESSGDYRDLGHHEMQVRVTGMLKQRAADFWVEEEIDALRLVAELGSIEGMPILVLANENFTGYVPCVAITSDQTEVVTGLDGNDHIVLKQRASVDEDDQGPIGFLSPDFFWAAKGVGPGEFMNIGIFSAPFLADVGVNIFLERGPWRVMLLEFEPDTVQVEVERS